MIRYSRGEDGTRLAYRELGEGRPLVLVHGFCGFAAEHWIRPGHAETLAAQGFRVIMPDLRGHGDSARPHDPGAYPPDVLAEDGLALLTELGLDGYDLGGYSLGARVVARMLARGARPGRAVLAGQGLAEITGTAPSRTEPVLRRVQANPGTFEPGSPEHDVERWLTETGGDPLALLRVLDSLVPTGRAELDGIAMPVLVLAGTEDVRRESARELAEALPGARYADLPGDHSRAITAPDFARLCTRFFAEVSPAW